VVTTVFLDPNLGARPPSQACSRPAVKFVLTNAILQSGALRFADSNHLPRMRLGQAAAQITGIIPVGRVGAAEYVAAAVLYLCFRRRKVYGGDVTRCRRRLQRRVTGIAPAAVFFASDDSKWITGETLHISRGLR
jgi:NAD(P)-dependent dehydrogenase (short-subunit alcohol dehydrogenase family)